MVDRPAVLETLLDANGSLIAEDWTLADIAVLPFIRQFAFVDKGWFDQAPYPLVRGWLEDFLNSDLFKSIMPKYAQWQPGDEPVIFPQGQRALASDAGKSWSACQRLPRRYASAVAAID